ncbi:hypothetical protein KJ870_08015 [bacterium]|jgi:uncharacterized protein with PQ loop repeat|nr:hypothetical protein [bacterium]MBU1434866.1 hypothetical protein [bacterium]MBU1503971.1 hypothetical protein [bacterium]
MKTGFYLFMILFAITLIFVLANWSVDGFDFFKFQEQHFYFQSWISIAGILFALTMSGVSYIIHKKTQLRSLKYIPLSFLLTALAYSITGYHASYCKICSDLGFCAASHNYPNYLVILALVLFALGSIMLSKKLNTQQRANVLYQFSFGLIVATTLLIIPLFISISFMETPSVISYFDTTNLQAFVFVAPLLMTLLMLGYFGMIYKISKIYLFMGILLSMSFVPQIYHIYSCQDCHNMECSEFYVLSGLVMFIVTGLLLHSLSIQLNETQKKRI